MVPLTLIGGCTYGRSLSGVRMYWYTSIITTAGDVNTLKHMMVTKNLKNHVYGGTRYSHYTITGGP